MTAMMKMIEEEEERQRRGMRTYCKQSKTPNIIFICSKSHTRMVESILGGLAHFLINGVFYNTPDLIMAAIL